MIRHGSTAVVGGLGIVTVRTSPWLLPTPAPKAER